MQSKRFITCLIAMITMIMGAHPALMASKKQEKCKNSSSACSTHQKKECCDKLKQIDETTAQDLLTDMYILSLVTEINKTVDEDLAVDEEILDKINQILECTCPPERSSR